MSLPVQMSMAHKQNGTIPVHSPHQPIVASEPAPSSVLAETTAATWLAIGSLAESLGDLEKALASYDSALRHLPNNPDALIKLANIYRSKDVFFKAAELYEQALNFNPENGETWGLLGHCYLMLDDLQRAYAAYQRALYYLDNPNVPKLWHGIGILYDRYGSLEYAEEAFVRVLELDPNFDKSNEIYFRLGIIYKHQGKLSSALECFQYILNNPPHPLTQPDVWFQIGSVLEQQKDWNGAKDAYERVLQVNPQHAKVLQQLGCLYSQAEAASPNAGNGGSQPFQQDLNIALKYLSQSLEIDQSDAHSWYYLGRVHMIRGDFNAAYEAFQQAVNRDSRNPTFWCSIGVLYYQISQYRDALDAYTRAIRLNPYISEVWYDLGTLYETCNNQISDALDAYRQAERLDPGNPHIKARLDQLIKYQQEGNTHPPQPPPVSQQPRLPQSMVLESTQGPPGAPGVPGAPGAPGASLDGSQHPNGPPPPQLIAGQPLNQLHQPPSLQTGVVPPLQQQSHHTVIVPDIQQPVVKSQQSTPLSKSAKHDLDEKKDKAKPKKKRGSNNSTPVVNKSQLSLTSPKNSLNSLMNAANQARELERPKEEEPSVKSPAPVPARTLPTVNQSAVQEPSPAPLSATPVTTATAPVLTTAAPVAEQLTPEQAPKATSAAPTTAPESNPTVAAYKVKSEPVVNPADEKDEDDEEPDKKKDEPVEPPMRKIDEDENYDDE